MHSSLNVFSMVGAEQFPDHPIDRACSPGEENSEDVIFRFGPMVKPANLAFSGACGYTESESYRWGAPAILVHPLTRRWSAASAATSTANW